MKCPDCGKEIGRFKVTADVQNDNTIETLRCPQSGRKMIPTGEATGKGDKGPKDWKRKKSRRRDFVPPERKKKPMVTAAIDSEMWSQA